MSQKFEKFVAELKQRIGETFIYSDNDRLVAYDFDGTDAHHLPDLVVEPVNTQQISELMKLATKYRIAVIPRGTGTGLTGGALAILGGVLLSLLKLNNILEIDEVNMTATVQPGVINFHLHQVLEERGMYYPPDPASYETSSIGGNIAEDAGGPHCYKYGTTRDYVLGMVVVLSNGEIINTGVKTRKGVVGYDLNDLIIGSEGTLGIVTEATLRLIPLPQSIVTILAFFPNIEDVVNSIAAFSKKRIVPATMEFLDRSCVDVIRNKLQFPIPEQTGVLLIIELDGETELLDKQVETIGEICFDKNAIDLLLADSSHKRQGLWEVRRKFRETLKEMVRFKRAEDIVIPISKIPLFIKQSGEIARKFGFNNYNYGHLGDGNVHANITYHENTADVKQRGHLAFEEIFALTLELEGTISGEHGIGITKKPYLAMELSPESIRIQKQIKKIFDPLNILNPGKIFS